MTYFKEIAAKTWWFSNAAILTTTVAVAAFLSVDLDKIVTFVVLYSIIVLLLLSEPAIEFLYNLHFRRFIANVRGRQDELVEETLNYVLANPKRKHVVVYRKTVSKLALEAQITKNIKVTYWPLSLAISGWVNKEEETTLSCTSVIRESTQYVQLCARLRGHDAEYRVRGYFSVSKLDAQIHDGLFTRGAKHHYHNTTKD